MTEIVHLHAVRTSQEVRPETLADFTLVDEGFAVRNGLELDDLEDEFGLYLCGYAYGGSVYIMVPLDNEEGPEGSRVVSWLVYSLTRGKSRPAFYARTDELLSKFNEHLDRRDALIQKRRRASMTLVA